MAHSVLSRVIYGTTRSELRLARKLKIRPAILHGYCRHQVKYVDYPGIIPEDGKSVKGTYVTGLTEEDIRKNLAARDKLRREGGWSYELSKDMM